MNIDHFCEYTYQFAHIPIYIYEEKSLVSFFHIGTDTVVPPEEILNQLDQKIVDVAVFETGINSFYGQIRLPEIATRIILGPVSPVSYTEASLAKFLGDYHVPKEDHQKYRNMFAQIPKYQFRPFSDLLRQMLLGLSGGTRDYTSVDFMSDQLPNAPDSKDYAILEKSVREQEYHNTLYDVYELTSPLISKGDLEGLVRYSKNQLPMNLGRFSSDPRKQQMVECIISTVNAMIASIQGGLDKQSALSLCELYISKALLLNSPADISVLGINAVVDFTTRVHNEKYRLSIHPSVYDCIHYIRERIYSPVTVADVAAFSGYSPEHFSRLFKKEMGQNARDFITSCKLEEAKRLLEFTKMSIGEISNQLYFADQSHFQRLFKKQYGHTPLQFRNSRIAS